MSPDSDVAGTMYLFRLAENLISPNDVLICGKSQTTATRMYV